MEKMRHLVRESRKLISGSFEPADFYELDSRLHSIWFLETKKNYIWEMIQKTDSDYSRFRMMDIVEMKNFEQIIDCLLYTSRKNKILTPPIINFINLTKEIIANTPELVVKNVKVVPPLWK